MKSTYRGCDGLLGLRYDAGQDRWTARGENEVRWCSAGACQWLGAPNARSLSREHRGCGARIWGKVRRAERAHKPSLCRHCTPVANGDKEEAEGEKSLSSLAVSRKGRHVGLLFVSVSDAGVFVLPSSPSLISQQCISGRLVLCLQILCERCPLALDPSW